MRDSVFFMLALTLSALIINKIHALIIMIIYHVLTILLLIHLKNSFITLSVHLILVFSLAYAVIVYYFVGVVEKAVRERDNSNLIIRNQAVELALKNEELYQTNKTKDKFISILAHDLKNPFQLLLGFSDLLKKKFHELDDTKKIEYINKLKNTVDRAYSMLEDLLSWGRGQSGTIEFTPVKLELKNLLNKNVSLFNDNCKNKNISIREEIEPDCFAVVDENMLNTVIRNLLSNAIKFTPSGGIIMVRAKTIYKEIIVEIADSGTGMDEQEINNLFKIDKHHSSVGTAGEMGTGLGLLICKEFIERNNGRILVKSDKGKGSTFSIILQAYPG